MKVFTTGQVAKICKVAPRTVSKWFDSGRLKGYRIPGSQDRRIPREYLIKFLKEHGMPLGDLEDEAMAKVLIVAQDQVLIENLKRELPPEKAFKVGTAASGFEAGIQAESFHPDCMIVDFSIGKVEALQICQNLRKNNDFTEIVLIALLPDDGETIVRIEDFACDEPHGAEVISVGDLGSGSDPYPGDDEMAELVAAECIPDFEDYVGIPYADSVYDIFPITPTEDGWEDDQTYVCLAFERGEELTESIEGAER